ncbi:MAG: hypothetical protein RBU45_05765, partial [Myxococcota bacterium]|nr:hypothetical protein [Myxococcota bacterium]
MPKYGATRSLPRARWARLGWLLLLGLLPVTAQGLPPAAPPRAPLAPLPAAPAAGGFHEGEVQRLLQRLEARRLLPEAYALLIRLWEERSRLADPDGLRPVLAAFAARHDLPPLLRSWASWYLAAAEQRVGRFDEARRQLAALGFPPDWRVLGPFQNHGGSGFDEPYLPELEARGGEPPAPSYAGVEGDIRWRTLPGLGALGRVDLAPLFARADEVLAYLEVGFALPAGGPIALRVGSADGVKVFVDGVEVHRNPARREAAFDQEAIPLVLEAGWHRLLLKVAHETGGWTSYLRITRLDGGPVPGLRFAAAPPDVSTARLPAPARFPVPPGLVEPLQLAQAALDRARSGKRPQPAVVAEALALRAFLESRLGPADRREGRDAGLYREAVQLAPARADLFLGLAEALADDENGRRAAFEEALRLSPGWVPALEGLARHYDRRGDTDHAWRTDDLLLAVDPGNVLARQRWAERFDELEQRARGLVELHRLHGVYPRHPGLLQALARQQSRQGLKRQAVATLERAIALDEVNLSLRSLLLAWYGDLGDLAGMLRQLDTVLQIWPHSLDYGLRRCRLLAENDRRAEALVELQRLRQTFPEHPLLLETLGRQQLLAGERAAALDSLQQALALRPQDTDLRRYLRFLSPGEQTLEDRFALPTDTLRAIPRPPDAAATGAYRPFVLRAVEVHPNGLRTTFTQLSLVVTDSQRLESFQSVPIGYTPGEEQIELRVAERIT